MTHSCMTLFELFNFYKLYSNCQRTNQCAVTFAWGSDLEEAACFKQVIIQCTTVAIDMCIQVPLYMKALDHARSSRILQPAAVALDS